MDGVHERSPSQTHSTPISTEHTFDLFAFRFRFRTLAPLHFPPGKAGNVIRGTLGRIFRKYACITGCRGARTCERRATCPYARLFEPTAMADGPSGFADWPRPFVVRASHLDGRRLRLGETFHFDFFIFAMHDPALAYFAFSFSQLIREGLGPGRSGAELIAIHQLNGMREEAAQIFDGRALLEPQPITLSLETEGPPVSRAEVRFLTPTELKSAGQIVREPEFGILFARIRDRIHTLRRIYGNGPLPFDFDAAGERARKIRLARSELRWENCERRSGKTGQTHPLGGFVGVAEYYGDLTEFLPYLRAGSWTGVGRQTTWGKGHIEVIILN